MKRLLAVSLLLAVSVLAGCASHVSPELRPYTAEETKELALETLNRRGLSFDEYQAKKPSCSASLRKFSVTTTKVK